MKKLAFVLVVLGSGLAAFGFAGWQAVGNPVFLDEPGYLRFSAGWTLAGQLEITIGVVLLVCGLLLRRDSR